MWVLQAALFDISLAYLLLLAGVILIIGEALAPGTHVIVVGVALLLAGLVGTLFGPLSPLVLAAIVLVTGLATFYIYREFEFYSGDDHGQTTHSDTLRGELGHVTEQVTPRGGEVKLENGGFNPYYSAQSESGTIEEGEEVMVLDPGGGNVLTVAPVGGSEMDAIDRELAREQSTGGSTEAAESGTEQEPESEPNS